MTYYITLWLYLIFLLDNDILQGHDKALKYGYKIHTLVTCAILLAKAKALLNTKACSTHWVRIEKNTCSLFVISAILLHQCHRKCVAPFINNFFII